MEAIEQQAVEALFAGVGGDYLPEVGRCSLTLSNPR
jgi:hypothetical protein